MRIVQIVPGSGGSFYCENCIRDGSLVKVLSRQGCDITMVPMYLPLALEGLPAAGKVPIFFGGLNAYLQQKLGFFRWTPRWFDRPLDSEWLLRYVAKKAASVRASGHGAMTLSMLSGADGHQAKEFERLLTWLNDIGRPEIVHLSNALLLGLAPLITRRLGVPVVCSLQDEDEWIDALDRPYNEQCWAAMRARAADVAVFIPVSRYYAGVMQERLGLETGRMMVVSPGVDCKEYCGPAGEARAPAIGYMARTGECMGLGILVDAFIELRREARFQNLRLRIGGGSTGDDVCFLDRQKRKLQECGLAGEVNWLNTFEPARRVEFFRSLSVFSVPRPTPEAFGLYLLEALACGVPIVQPRLGSFTELVESTGGGVLCEPASPSSLAAGLAALLGDPARAAALGAAGAAAVRRDFSLERMAEKMMGVYGIA